MSLEPARRFHQSMLYSYGVSEKGQKMGTQPPRIEARVSAQERMQTILHARIEELSEDMLSSFSEQAAYQVRIEEKIDSLREDLALMATKEDVAALEKRVLDAFQQLLTVIDQRLPPLEK